MNGRGREVTEERSLRMKIYGRGASACTQLFWAVGGCSWLVSGACSSLRVSIESQRCTVERGMHRGHRIVGPRDEREEQPAA